MKKWRLNLFDVVIIALVIAAAYLFLRLRTGGAPLVGSGSAVTVRYTIELINMTPEATERIKPGDSITDKIEKLPMGRVVSVDVEPYTSPSKDWETGDYNLREIPGRYTAKLILEASATETETNITTSGAYIVRCGTTVNAIGPGYAGTGYVVDVFRDELEAGA